MITAAVIANTPAGTVFTREEGYLFERLSHGLAIHFGQWLMRTGPNDLPAGELIRITLEYSWADVVATSLQDEKPDYDF